MARLENRSAIVTGAASGIGRASATLFAAEGAAVVCIDLDGSGLAETVKSIEDAGGRALAIEASAADEAAIANAVARCVDTFGGLDVFYANAGITGDISPLLENTAEDFRNVLEVNLVGTFIGIQNAARHMQDHAGGSIICTASVAGLRSGAGPAAYAASKAGIINLVMTASRQLADTGVRVNAICPGLIETGMTKPLFDMARAAGTEEKIGQLNPLRRAGAPDEIAAMALFLASDESSYVNGQAIAVDGGLSSSLPFVPGPMG